MILLEKVDIPLGVIHLLVFEKLATSFSQYGVDIQPFYTLVRRKVIIPISVPSVGWGCTQALYSVERALISEFNHQFAKLVPLRIVHMADKLLAYDIAIESLTIFLLVLCFHLLQTPSFSGVVFCDPLKRLDTSYGLPSDERLKWNYH